MEQIGAIPEQISQYMQNQSAMPLPGQNPNANLPIGGMFPGSNPMDILQYQQMQQMRQMQQQQQQQQLQQAPPKKWFVWILTHFILP